MAGAVVDKQSKPFCADKKSDVQRSSVTAQGHKATKSQSHKVSGVTSLVSQPGVTVMPLQHLLWCYSKNWSLTAAQRANSQFVTTDRQFQTPVISGGMHSARGVGGGGLDPSTARRNPLHFFCNHSTYTQANEHFLGKCYMTHQGCPGQPSRAK